MCCFWKQKPKVCYFCQFPKEFGTREVTIIKRRKGNTRIKPPNELSWKSFLFLSNQISTKMAFTALCKLEPLNKVFTLSLKSKGRFFILIQPPRPLTTRGLLCQIESHFSNLMWNLPWAISFPLQWNPWLELCQSWWVHYRRIGGL